MVHIGLDLQLAPKERTALEIIINEALCELRRGDDKYGPHKTYLRAYGALRAELAELKTELDDGTPEAIRKEALQVVAMAIKLVRDVFYP